MKTFGTRIGILGGGQLARMLCLQGHRMGLEMHVLCPDSSEPAAQVTQFHHEGDPTNSEDLDLFFASVDIVTIESEFFEGEVLAECEKKTDVPIFPSARAISIVQDRLSQKELLNEHEVPTAAYMAIHNIDDFKEAASHFGNLVLKKRMGGYDGNGTFVLQSGNDWNEIMSKINLSENNFIAEAFVPFKKELAVMIVRNSRGEMINLPLVQTHQKDHRCDWVSGPVEHRRFSFVLKKLFKMLESINYVGTIGFELFDTGKDLLVNELAPRVHNSGHYSLDALSEDQFTLHLKAILDYPLMRPRSLSKHFAMSNLIGSTSTAVPELPDKVTGQVHWYGKKHNRKGRKMGHINYLGETKSILNKALAERKLIQGL